MKKKQLQFYKNHLKTPVPTKIISETYTNSTLSPPMRLITTPLSRSPPPPLPAHLNSRGRAERETDPPVIAGLIRARVGALCMRGPGEARRRAAERVRATFRRVACARPLPSPRNSLSRARCLSRRRWRENRGVGASDYRVWSRPSSPRRCTR